MSDKKIGPLFITLVISAILLFGCIMCAYFLRKDLFERDGDFSAQIRNIAVSSVAISGIPLLILGHINRRNDIALKRQDNLFKAEAEVVNKVYEELSPLTDMIKKLLESSFERTKAKSVSEVIRELVLLIADDYNEIVLDRMRECQYWDPLRSKISALCNTIELISDVENKKLRTLAYSKITSSFDEYELSEIYFLGLVYDYEDIHSNFQRRIILWELYQELYKQGFTTSKMLEESTIPKRKFNLSD